MKIFNVYDQRMPIRNSRMEYEANLPFCGQIEALNETAAIEEAIRRRWSKWPIVIRAENDE